MNVNEDNWEDHWSKYSMVIDHEPARKWRRGLVIERILASNPKSILDLGSGKGDLLIDLNLKSQRLRLGATDTSTAALHLLQLNNKNIQCVQVNLDISLDSANRDELLSEGKWDVLVCCEVLEHLDNPSIALKTIKELSSAGSRLVLTVPGGPIAKIDRDFGHRKHYKRKDLRQLLESEGFIVDHIGATGFPFFNLYRLGLVIFGKGVMNAINQMSNSKPTKPKLVVLQVFGWLFKLNLNSLPIGWQLIGECRTP